MSNNRTKGHDGERYYAKVFREELGFDNCCTSRYASRLLDNCKIDLVNIPYCVQIKTGYHKSMKAQIVLKELSDAIHNHLPENSENKDYPKVLIHRLQGTKGKARTEFDDLVTMTFNDFKKLISKK